MRQQQSDELRRGFQWHLFACSKLADMCAGAFDSAMGFDIAQTFRVCVTWQNQDGEAGGLLRMYPEFMQAATDTELNKETKTINSF